jgi:hypothetical protein
MLLALKLLLTPTLVGLVSAAGRRWGPTVSGWLVGLPLTSAPVALLLALTQGTMFAARAAQGTLLGLASVAGFCLVYSWLAAGLVWQGSLLLSWCIFFAVTWLLERVSLSLPLAFASVIACLALTLLLLPRQSSKSEPTTSPRWETPLRMVVATCFVLLLTGAASLLGPRLSGLLTPFPIFASILGAFTHRFQGAMAARRLLRGVLIGSFTFAVFFLILAAIFPRWGIAPAFALAIPLSLLLHGCSLWLISRYSRRYALDRTLTTSRSGD